MKTSIYLSSLYISLTDLNKLYNYSKDTQINTQAHIYIKYDASILRYYQYYMIQLIRICRSQSDTWYIMIWLGLKATDCQGAKGTAKLVCSCSRRGSWLTKMRRKNKAWPIVAPSLGPRKFYGVHSSDPWFMEQFYMKYVKNQPANPLIKSHSTSECEVNLWIK